MELRQPQPFAIHAPARLNWPGTAGKTASPASQAAIARQFETLIAETLLHSARAASLGDDGLGASGDNIRSMVDHAHAEAIARAAPMGVARILATEAR